MPVLGASTLNLHSVYTEAEVTEKVAATEPGYAKPDAVNTTAKAESPKTTIPNTTTTENIITKDEAKAAVLKHAGLAESDVKRFDIELDRERNGLVYEVDFDAGKYEYEYEVDAVTGEVLRNHKEYKD